MKNKPGTFHNSPLLEYKEFPHNFNLIGMRARVKLRKIYNDSKQLDILKKINEKHDLLKKPIDLFFNNKNKNNEQTSIKLNQINPRVFLKYKKKSYEELFKDECEIVKDVINSENKVIHHYHKNNFILIKQPKEKRSDTVETTITTPINRNNCLSMVNKNIDYKKRIKIPTMPPFQLRKRIDILNNRNYKMKKSNSLPIISDYEKKYTPTFSYNHTLKNNLSGKRNQIIDNNVKLLPNIVVFTLNQNKEKSKIIDGFDFESIKKEIQCHNKHKLLNSLLFE